MADVRQCLGRGAKGKDKATFWNTQVYTLDMRLSQEDTRDMGFTKGKGEAAVIGEVPLQRLSRGAITRNRYSLADWSLPESGGGVYSNFWESIASVQLCGWVNRGFEK